MSDATRSVNLEVEGLRSGYHGVTVLKGLDFSVGDEVFAVLGANGAGKTTLLATLARPRRLPRPSSCCSKAAGGSRRSRARDSSPEHRSEVRSPRGGFAP